MSASRAALLTAAAATTAIAAALPVSAGNGNERPRGDLAPATVAVIGDVPYGGGQPENLGLLIDELNDRDLDLVVHLGDTKSGSTLCSDEHFEFIADSFANVQSPLFYTPGDNEWTDCHRDNNGDYNPLDRLAKIRETYFAQPGFSLSAGEHFRVDTQAADGFPENQTWYQNGVQIGLVHVVGSNNGMAPWALGADDHDLAAERIAEVDARNAAGIAWINQIFDNAEKKDAAGVMLTWHGDLWAVFEHSNGIDMSGSDDIVAVLAARADEFGKPVLLVNGDSHDFYSWTPLSDADTHPLAPYYGNVLAGFNSSDYHGVGGDIDNVTQVVFDVWDRFSPEPAGFDAEDFGWLEVTIDATSPEVFTFEQQFLDLP